MKSSKLPEVTIVLLSYNRVELTKRALKNLLNDIISVDFELIVVDNNSTDGTREYLESLNDPRLRLVLNEKNFYFSGGNNCGLGHARGKYILLTQNDMTFTPHSMRNFIDLYGLFPDAGCLGIGGGFINRSGVIKEISDWWQNPLRQFDFIPVDFVSGCCMFVERRVMEKDHIRFDTNYRLYWEDVDICHQIRETGFSIYMIHNGLIGTRHLRSGTITPLLGFQERERVRAESEQYYRNKWNHFYKNPDKLLTGIHYGLFFPHLRVIMEGNSRRPDEIPDHENDALEVAPFEFYEFQEDYEEALQGYKEVIKNNPDNFLAYRNLYRVISSYGDLDEKRQVLSHFQACLDRNPPVALRSQLYSYIQAALLRIARDFADTGEYALSHNYYDELQKIAQTGETISLCEIEKAKMKYLMGMYDASEQELKAWLKKNEFLDLDPMMYTAAHFYLGELAYKRNEMDVAIDRYTMTLTIDSDHRRARGRLKEINLKKDGSHYDKAHLFEMPSVPRAAR